MILNRFPTRGYQIYYNMTSRTYLFTSGCSQVSVFHYANPVNQSIPHLYSQSRKLILIEAVSSAFNFSVSREAILGGFFKKRTVFIMKVFFKKKLYKHEHVLNQ